MKTIKIDGQSCSEMLTPTLLLSFAIAIVMHRGLRVNHYDFVTLHSTWIIFLKGLCVLERVEIIHKSKFLPGTVEKNSSTIRSSGRNRTYACAMPVHCSDH